MNISRLGTERRRMSKIVIHNDTVYLCGQVAEDANADIREQTRTMLAKVSNRGQTTISIGDRPLITIIIGDRPRFRVL
jgi:enamine deaminase RidA (YjgF/YER057c/UK114 family)